MNKEQKKDMYQFYFKMFFFITILYYLMWITTNHIGKELAIFGFSISIVALLFGVIKTYKDKL
jgi:c-di-AMP phosphodiesterase-like protein